MAPGKGNKRTQHLSREAEEISWRRFWCAVHENCEYTFWEALDLAIKRYKLVIEVGEVCGTNVLEYELLAGC